MGGDRSGGFCEPHSVPCGVSPVLECLNVLLGEEAYID